MEGSGAKFRTVSEQLGDSFSGMFVGAFRGRRYDLGYMLVSVWSYFNSFLKFLNGFLMVCNCFLKVFNGFVSVFNGFLKVS